jgi:hypothetical protein
MAIEGSLNCPFDDPDRRIYNLRGQGSQQCRTLSRDLAENTSFLARGHELRPDRPETQHDSRTGL